MNLWPHLSGIVILDLHFFYPLVFFEVVQELSDGSLQDRMDKILINFSQGDKDKLTILSPGMRDLELFGVYFNIIEEEDIQIDRPRSPSNGSCTAQPGFDGLQCP